MDVVVGAHPGGRAGLGDRVRPDVRAFGLGNSRDDCAGRVVGGLEDVVHPVEDPDRRPGEAHRAEARVRDVRVGMLEADDEEAGPAGCAELREDRREGLRDAIQRAGDAGLVDGVPDEARPDVVEAEVDGDEGDAAGVGADDARRGGDLGPGLVPATPGAVERALRGDARAAEVDEPEPRPAGLFHRDEIVGVALVRAHPVAVPGHRLDPYRLGRADRDVVVGTGPPERTSLRARRARGEERHRHDRDAGRDQDGRRDREGRTGSPDCLDRRRTQPPEGVRAVAHGSRIRSARSHRRDRTGRARRRRYGIVALS